MDTSTMFLEIIVTSILVLSVTGIIYFFVVKYRFEKQFKQFIEEHEKRHEATKDLYKDDLNDGE